MIIEKENMVCSLMEETILAKKAHIRNAYLIKSKDEILEFIYSPHFESEQGAIEIEGRNYYQDSNYLIEGENEEGKYKYALVIFVENIPFRVKKDGTVSEDYYYSSKSPCINGHPCIKCEYELEDIHYILNEYESVLLEEIKYYGYVQSEEDSGNYENVLFQLYVLEDYANMKGIKYESIFGIYNLPLHSDENLEVINFNTLVEANFDVLKEIRQTDVVCTITNILPDCDGEYAFGFIEKNILKEWLLLKGLKDYRLLKK